MLRDLLAWIDDRFFKWYMRATFRFGFLMSSLKETLPKPSSTPRDAQVAIKPSPTLAPSDQDRPATKPFNVILAVFAVCASAAFIWYYTTKATHLYYRIDLTRVFLQRLLTLALGGVAGFLIGAFFSPLLKPFRVFLWIALAILVVLYGLFGDYPQADTLDYGLAGLAFLITLSVGLKLGIKAYLTVAKRRPTSFGSRTRLCNNSTSVVSG